MGILLWEESHLQCLKNAPQRVCDWHELIESKVVLWFWLLLRLVAVVDGSWEVVLPSTASDFAYLMF
jgi:hypothetical protein